jgi:hypothetical protein
MRLSREHFFDLVELVGKALASSRTKPADDSWLDENLLFPHEKQENQDPYGLFEGSSWKDGAGRLPGLVDRRAQRSKNEVADSMAATLWDIHRQVRFKLTTVTDGLDQLRELCDRMLAVKLVTSGWSTMVRTVIDRRCL